MRFLSVLFNLGIWTLILMATIDLGVVLRRIIRRWQYEDYLDESLRDVR